MVLIESSPGLIKRLLHELAAREYPQRPVMSITLNSGRVNFEGLRLLKIEGRRSGRAKELRRFWFDHKRAPGEVFKMLTLSEIAEVEYEQSTAVWSGDRGARSRGRRRRARRRAREIARAA